MKTYKYLGVIVIIAMLLALIPVGSVSAAAAKSDICHYDKDAGVFFLINISDNAYESHLAHGDVKPQDPVPGMLGMVYGEDCLPVRVFADVSGNWVGTSGLVTNHGAYAFTMNLTQVGKVVSGTITYPSLSITRSVTGEVVGSTLEITTSGGTYWATVSGSVTETYFYGVGTDSNGYNVALEAFKLP